jgi:Zn-dependent protease with chaperone function
LNFFEHQDLARRETRRLVLLFIIAVINVVLAVNAIALLVWRYGMSGLPPPVYFHETTTLFVLVLILGGTWFETSRLRAGGGDEVADMMGARLIARHNQQAQEVRLLNIVEEMSIASGVTMPRVYVMDNENSINAFAAGSQPNEAVIVVSQGALERLNRDELQGVVAHEFSHILNGDMQLNIRLIGLVYGLLMVALLGEKLMSSLRITRGGDDRGLSFILFFAGLALWVVGYIGVFFARLIKSSVSRQREFLADASAVQFTRNLDGIGGALRKIAGLSKTGRLGSRIDHANAEALSHLFLGAVKPSLSHGWFSTHPPMRERLHRLYGRYVPELASSVEATVPETAAPELGPMPYAAVSQLSPAELIQAVGKVHPVAAGALSPLHHWREAVKTSEGAQAAVLGLLRDESVPQRLMLVDLAIPALKNLSRTQRQAFLQQVHAVIQQDGRVTSPEFLFETLLTRRLRPYSGKSVPVKFMALFQVQAALEVILAFTAYMVRSDKLTQQNIEHKLSVGAQQLGLALKTLPLAQLNFSVVTRSLDQLNQLSPLLKPVVIKAVVTVAQTNGTRPPSEMDDVIRAICAALDCPLPPFMSQYAA